MAWTSIRRRKKRKRRGYVRPSRAKPKTGWTLRQLASIASVSLRTVRLYLQLGLIPRPPFAGPATRYQRRELVWLLAIRKLQTTGTSSLTSIRSRLNALSPPELEALATEGVSPGPIADALGVQPAPPLIPPELASVFGRRNPLYGGARWVRHELALGLEINVREDASPGVLELVREIRELCE